MKAIGICAVISLLFAFSSLQGCGSGPSQTPAPTAPPTPAPTTPATKKMACSQCHHVYDPLKDCGGAADKQKDCGSGVAFEDLPAEWKCPICGASKSAFKPQAEESGLVQWVETPHAHDASQTIQAVQNPAAKHEECRICFHVYDPLQDCGGYADKGKDCGSGVAFSDLPDDWRCPVCNNPKSAYAPVAKADGTVQWVEKDHVEVV